MRDVLVLVYKIRTVLQERQQSQAAAVGGGRRDVPASSSHAIMAPLQSQRTLHSDWLGAGEDAAGGGGEKGAVWDSIHGAVTY